MGIKFISLSKRKNNHVIDAWENIGIEERGSNRIVNKITLSNSTMYTFHEILAKYLSEYFK
jgi:hypothetical protein